MTDSREPTQAEEACFEAGIKFGTLYHQFAGTPVSTNSASSLATAMEEAIENQPYCESVSVTVDTEALTVEIESGTASYTELTGRFLEVTMQITYEETVVRTEMELVDGYPLMNVRDIKEI